jgi:hypothetical protein
VNEAEARVAGGGVSTRTWMRAAAVVAVAFLVATWIDRPFVGGDTPFVLDGTNAFLQCMEAHVFVACGDTGELNDRGLTGSIGNWPLLQHVPDLTALALGADGHPARNRILMLLSMAGVLGSIVLGRIVLVRTGQSAWFWGYVFVVLSGPTLTYGRSTNGEMFAMGLLVALVAATTLRAPPLVIGVAAFGASVTKETAYPFVAALGLVGLILARRRTGAPIAAHLAAGAGGIALALVTTSLFNVVRFGSVVNPNLVEPELHTPGVLRTIDYAAAVLVSPSGGIVVFWLSASAVILAACVMPLLRSGGRRDARIALVLAGVTAALTVGFARWWTPFGWAEYGPRLMMPWVVPLVLISLVAYGDLLGELARRLVTPPWRLIALFLAVVVLTIPHIGNLLQPGETAEFFAAKEPPCAAPFGNSVERWHDCQHELMWFAVPMPVYAAQGILSFEGAFTLAAVSAGLLACLILLRADLLARAASPSIAGEEAHGGGR